MYLAYQPCPEDQFNDLHQCLPYSTLVLTFGTLCVSLAGISFIFLVTVICLRFSPWYTREREQISLEAPPAPEYMDEDDDDVTKVGSPRDKKVSLKT